jgi:hypothetical protein
MSMRAREKGALSVVLALVACGGSLAQSPLPALPGALPSPMPLASPPPAPAGLHPEPATEAGAEEPEPEGCGCRGRGFFLEADYLYLRPLLRPNDYAIIDPTSRGVPEGSVQSLNLPWRSGLRAGGGFDLSSGWGVRFFYTYLHSAAGDAISAPAGGVLFSTLTHPGTVSEVETAVASTSLNYNVFDLDFGRRFQPCDNVSLRLFGGPRFARIETGFNVTYNGLDANQDMVFNRLNFNGTGLMVGGEGNWAFCHGFGVFARATGSMLAGEFTTQLFEGNNGGSTILTNVNDRFEKVVPVLELSMGGSWQYRNLCLSVGYQFINWFGLLDVPDFVDDVHQGKDVRRTGDLSLNGLVARLALTF